MELDTFVKNFGEQFDDTELSEFKAETVYHDLEEWSSIQAISIMAMVDEEYDVKLKADDIRSAQTIEQLYEIVKAKL